MSFEKPSSWDESVGKVLNYTHSHCLMKIWTGKAGSCVRPKYVRTGSFGPKMIITEPFLRTAGIIILTARIYDKCSISTAGGSQGLGKAHQLLVRFLTLRSHLGLYKWKVYDLGIYASKVVDKAWGRPTNQGCSPRGKTGCPAPPRENKALPRPAEIDKTRGAQQGEAKRRHLGLVWGYEGKALHLAFWTACDFLFCRKAI